MNKEFIKEIKLAKQSSEQFLKENPSKQLQVNNIIQLLNSNLLNSRFVPDNIKDYILSNPHNLTQNIIKLGKKTIVINILSTKTIKSFYMKLIIAWFIFIDKYKTKTCGNYLTITICLTPFKKEIYPGDKILGPKNVNTGVTTACSENSTIFIYRKEEWFKVLLHETFHNYNLDFTMLNLSNAQMQLKKMFPIESDFLISEIYAEFWAIYLFSLFYSVWHSISATIILEDQKK